MSTGPPLRIGRLVVPPWQSNFYCSVHSDASSEKCLIFPEPFCHERLLLGGPHCRGVISGVVQWQKHAALLCRNLPQLLLAQGVRSGLLWGSMPQTPHFNWLVNIIWSEPLLSTFCRSWEVLISGSLRSLPRNCLLSLRCCLALLVGSTAGSSRGLTCLICRRGSR